MPATNQGNLEEVRYEMCWCLVDEYPCGWTKGGIGISGSSESSGIEVDQETDPIITVQTKTATEIKVPVAQWSERNLQLAFPGSEWRGAGTDRYLAVGSAAESPPHTLRLHPKNMPDDDFSKDLFFPSVTVSSNLDMTINKGELQLLNLTFSAGPGSPPKAEKAGDKMYYGTIPAGARVAVTGISLTETGPLTLAVGQQAALAALIAPENATVRTVEWSSSDEAVAEVSDTGVVYAAAAGTAAITAKTKDGNFTASRNVTVS